MKAILILLCSITLTAAHLQAQSMYFTRNGKVSFFSKTPMENIDAVNNEVFSVIDFQKGEIAFAILIKSFRFERALMEEHFNENYMESTKFPKATFNGKINNTDKINLKQNGTYPVQITGDMTIHGVTKKITAEGKMTIDDNGISALSNFLLKVKDFDIAIPSLVAEKIADTVEVTVDCQYKPKESK
ncbi:MAG: YceI family protein [Cyclobacteriaceae bacterium]